MAPSNVIGDGRHRMRLPYFFVLLYSAAASVEPARADMSLDQLLDAHRSARESIRSMHVIVALRIVTHLPVGGRPPTVVTCEWWQDGKNVRYATNVAEDLSGGAHRYLTPSERKTAIGESGNRTIVTGTTREGDVKRVSGIIDDPRFDPGPYTPWAQGLFELDNATHAFLDTVLSKGRDKLRNVALSWNGGLATVTFDEKDRIGHELVFDPASNYLVRRHRTFMYSADRKTQEQPYEKEIKEFKEVAPGIFFPTKTEIRCFGKNGLKWTGSVTLDVKMVNDQIPSEQLSLTFPKGLEVADYKSQEFYVVGEEGEKTNVRPLGSVMFGTVMPGQTPAWRGFMSMGLIAAGVGIFAIMLRKRFVRRAEV
jgi:hypothetical protein